MRTILRCIAQAIMIVLFAVSLNIQSLAQPQVADENKFCGSVSMFVFMVFCRHYFWSWSLRPSLHLDFIS